LVHTEYITRMPKFFIKLKCLASNFKSYAIGWRSASVDAK